MTSSFVHIGTNTGEKSNVFVDYTSSNLQSNFFLLEFLGDVQNANDGYSSDLGTGLSDS